ncbi:sugar nucleotide-binding protein [Endozoicomonas sp. SM1973]|uniref:dTDP-4-dehydrorhamnose reductase n=1 Tax=Spartinivicinus marinus TaxID=2994442 RepID=A0A853IE93_9GAMM|nr:sugar nucleotide-binding protein [Spartinivicinus marinus]MCX4025872.1 sugar nucleotide-binding protein [Spartinivicinus marinus]NYZ68858.1 sugar nucleotide-binding protein [Spartinivicinus marinus]
MKVLVFGGSGQVGHELCQQLTEHGIVFKAPSHDVLDITHSKKVAELVKSYQPTMVVNAVGYRDLMKAESEPSKCFAINRDAVAEMANICKKHQATLIHLSSYLVFDGAKAEPYTEKDAANPQGVLAGSLWQGEQLVRERCPDHIILRLGWVVSARRYNLVHTILSQLKQNQEVWVASDRLGNPTPAADIAAVIIAILYQLDCEAEVFGTYHYGGVEPVAESKFAEVLLNDALHYDELPSDKLLVKECGQLDYLPHHLNARLAVNKIRDTFGIHAKAWRPAIAKIVKGFYV